MSASRDSRVRRRVGEGEARSPRATAMGACGGAAGLPMPPLLPVVRPGPAHHVVTAVDQRGRLADRSALRVLGWGPRCRLAVRVARGAAVAVAQPDGPETVTRQGHLRLPVAVRYALGLVAGDRLLVVVDPDREVLTAFTMATLDSMILAYWAKRGEVEGL
jgi:hypothetical protein